MSWSPFYTGTVQYVQRWSRDIRRVSVADSIRVHLYIPCTQNKTKNGEIYPFPKSVCFILFNVIIFLISQMNEGKIYILNFQCSFHDKYRVITPLPASKNFPSCITNGNNIIPWAIFSVETFVASPQILCSCRIITNLKLRYSISESRPWFWSSRNSRTHLFYINSISCIIAV